MTRAWRTAIGDGRGVPFGKTIIAVQAALAVALVGLLLLGQGLSLPFVSDRYEIEALFSDAAGLDEAHRPPVTVAGVPLGQVKDVRYEDGQAIATLELDGDSRGRIHADATALVVPRSALNDLTVDIDPGSPRAGPLEAGSRISRRRTAGPVGLDRITEVLDSDTRAHLQVLLNQLGTGLRGRSGHLRAAVRELGPLLDSSGRFADALADRRRLLTRLVGDLEVTFESLGQRGRQLRQAITAGRVTVETVAGRDRELAASMRVLPGTLSALDRALSEFGRLAVPLQPALERLRPVARRLPEGLRALRELAPAGRGLMRDLSDLSRHGLVPLRELDAALTQLGPASRALAPPVRKLLPILTAFDENKDGIDEVGARFSGIFSTNDANGPVLRGLGFFEPFDPANFGMSGARGRRLAELELDVVRALTAVCLTENDMACLAPYLVPGLPGAVRSADRPLGDPRLTGRRSHNSAERPR